MANILQMEKKISVISALAEGNSIRSVERMTGIHRDTIMRLGVKVGEGCTALMDKYMRDLDCKRIEMDEIWGFIGKKKINATDEDKQKGIGDVWTFVAVDADTKLVPVFRCGKRDVETTHAFVADLAGRMKNRIQLSSDAMETYENAVEAYFGADVDYGQVVKTFASEQAPSGKYSPAKLVSLEKEKQVGNPDFKHISTSYIERQNLTMRMHMRRLTRLTNAFSKKLENFKAAVGLHFGYYNFVKMHTTLRATPAMASGITSKLWTVADLLERISWKEANI
jgi:IS1 family transposase